MEDRRRVLDDDQEFASAKSARGLAPWPQWVPPWTEASSKTPSILKIAVELDLNQYERDGEAQHWSAMNAREPVTVYGRLYTFFPFTASGVTLMFAARSLRSDDEAFAYARWLLQEEPSASEVFVCEGEREVALEKRRIRLKLVRPRREWSSTEPASPE